MIISLATLACQPEKPVQDTEITHAKPDSIIDEYLSQYKPYPMDFDGSNYNETEQAILKNLVKARFNGIIKPVSERLNYQWSPAIFVRWRIFSVCTDAWNLPCHAAKHAMPHLESFIEGGTRAKALISSFPSKTFPNHYSLVTGMYPGNHGMVDNDFYNAKRKVVYDIKKREVVQDAAFCGSAYRSRWTGWQSDETDKIAGFAC